MLIQRCLIYVFAAGLVLLVTGSAVAIDPNTLLQGTYRLYGEGTCASNPVGWDLSTTTPSLEAGAAGGVTPLYFNAVVTYDGNGNATTTSTAQDGISFLTHFFGALSQPVLTFIEFCNFTYTVNPADRTYTRNGSCTGATTGGPGVGDTYTLTGLMWKGQIGEGGAILREQMVVPVEQALTVFSGGSPIFTTKRLCGGGNTQLRISKK